MLAVLTDVSSYEITKHSVLKASKHNFKTTFYEPFRYHLILGTGNIKMHDIYIKIKRLQHLANNTATKFNAIPLL